MLGSFNNKMFWRFFFEFIFIVQGKLKYLIPLANDDLLIPNMQTKLKYFSASPTEQANVPFFLQEIESPI